MATAFKSKSTWGYRKAFLPAGHGRDSLAVTDRIRELLVEEFLHLWFMIEEILLRGGPVHMQVNEILGLGSKVGKTGKCRMNIGLRGEVLSEGFL